MSKSKERAIEFAEEEMLNVPVIKKNGLPKENIYSSLAKFQQECPVIHKGTKGYGYSYADLPTIFNVIMPLLKKNNLGFTQLIDGAEIRTILFHTISGDTIESCAAIPQDVQLKGMNAFQVYGSAITYFRRYALSSLLGIITDKDTDAGGEQIKRLPKISNKRLNEAINAINNESYTTKLLLQNFELTKTQIETLKNETKKENDKV